MSIEGLTATLEERGLIWQGSGFASIGLTSLVLLSVYSEADHWNISARRNSTQLGVCPRHRLSHRKGPENVRDKNRNPKSGQGGIRH